MIRERRGMTQRNVDASWLSTVKAIIAAPKTTNGDLMKRRRNMLIPFWTSIESLVRRVIIVGAPIRSLSLSERDATCWNNAFFIFTENPTAAFAEKYCAVMDAARPIKPRTTMMNAIENTWRLFPSAIPSSIRDATARGTASSNNASSSLNSGARTASLR